MWPARSFYNGKCWSVCLSVGLWSVGLSVENFVYEYKIKKSKFFDCFWLFDELRSWPYMISRQRGMKTDKDKIVWSHMTIIPFPQKCIRPELIRPCRACFSSILLTKLILDPHFLELDFFDTFNFSTQISFSLTQIYWNWINMDS